MNPQKLTLKSQEALQTAQEIASNYGNQEIMPEHLLAALIQNDENISAQVIEKIGAPLAQIKIKINELIERLPKVSGANIANQQVGRALGAVLETAEKEAKQLGDEFTSVKHLLIATALDKLSSAGDLLRKQGITKDAILKVLKDIRG